MTIGVQQIEELVKELLPTGFSRFKRNPGTKEKPRLTNGVEFVNNKNKWAISIFFNVNNKNNDVEIAMAPGRIATDGLAEDALKWLETVSLEFQHQEHSPHRGSYKGHVFRIGLKLGEAKLFLRRFMSEVLKQPTQSPWVTTRLEVVVDSLAVVEPLSSRVGFSARSPKDEYSKNERARSIEHMVEMAFLASDQSGMRRVKSLKDKHVRFVSPEHLYAHLDALWTSQYCALSGLKLDLNRIDPELAPSLDRIDSNEHYEIGNLQVVARFINRWKSDEDQKEFLRLLALVKAVPRCS